MVRLHTISKPPAIRALVHVAADSCSLACLCLRLCLHVHQGVNLVRWGSQTDQTDQTDTCTPYIQVLYPPLRIREQYLIRGDTWHRPYQSMPLPSIHFFWPLTSSLSVSLSICMSVACRLPFLLLYPGPLPPPANIEHPQPPTANHQLQSLVCHKTFIKTPASTAPRIPDPRLTAVHFLFNCLV